MVALNRRLSYGEAFGSPNSDCWPSNTFENNGGADPDWIDCFPRISWVELMMGTVVTTL